MASSMQLFGRDDALLIVVPGPDTYTTPALTANLVLRILLSILASLVCVVPLRLLYRNGEFAASVFIVNIMVKNLDTIINALIWRDDNTDAWWPGHGFCDVNPYLRNFTVGLYATCLLAIMRNLAQQVGLLRANPLTVREKRRRNLVQALIMFPLPIVQLVWIWPLTTQRYVVGTLVGCSWVASLSWPYIVLFVLAPVVVALVTAGYAVLIYTRFRELAKTTHSALTSNRVAHLRAQRTKRRLYLMVLSILTPFLPIVITLAVLNILDATPLTPFDYDTIHNHPFPFKWNTIVYLPSNTVGFAYMNICYIPILSAVPIFIFFGMTKDAMNSYRRGLLKVGLGHVFPGLNEEYDPDREAYGDGSYGSRLTGTTTSTTRSSKFRFFLSSRHTTTAGDDSHTPHLRSQSFALTSIDVEQGRDPQQQAQPPPQSAVHSRETTPGTLPHRNPFTFRTRLDFPILPIFKPKHPKHPPVPLDSLPPLVQHPHWDRTHAASEPARVQTRVWSEDEVGLFSDSPTDAVDSSTSFDVPAAVMVETRLTRESHRR
ncbi:hypothetical protein G7046_g288 [Stylonectria norvegica]|nr:hypothetical protein G7046_g288 [Stylonectria norvegica]